MSDVSNAPAPAPAAPATPAPANEVPISTPTGSPQPIGVQTPDKPPAEARRESIQRAFDKARDSGDGEASKKPPAAKPRQPVAEPDRKAKGADDQGTLDLRKTPQERHREQGRFAKAPDAQQGQQQPEQQAAQPGQQKPPVNPLPEGSPYRDAPPRMADHAKAEWAAAPESVRGEVYRMHQEFEGAYRNLRADHEEMETIRPFHEMAKQHGTSLSKALTNYVGMENKLRSDLIGGLDVIISNLNLHTQDGRKIGIRDVAYHILNQSPEQHKMLQTQNATQAQSQQIGQLHQLVGTLAQSVQQMHYERQFGQTRSAVDQFADAHPRFDELGELIEQELRYGFSLEEAYQRADRLKPPTGNARAAQTRNPTAQTRSDKSISGAPDGGPSSGPTTRRKDDKTVGRREAIQNAIRRVNGGV